LNKFLFLIEVFTYYWRSY